LKPRCCLAGNARGFLFFRHGLHPQNPLAQLNLETGNMSEGKIVRSCFRGAFWMMRVLDFGAALFFILCLRRPFFIRRRVLLH
jgi:hypothetical protein